MSPSEELFLAAGIWTALALLFLFAFRSWRVRIGLFIALVGVPFWELPFGYLNYRWLCAEHARVQVFEKIAPQESVCISRLDGVLYHTLSNLGFKRIEVTEQTYTPSSDYRGGARIVDVRNDKPESTYCIEYQDNIAMRGGVVRHDMLVIRPTTKAIAAKQSRVMWRGLYWQVAAAPVLGFGGECSTESTDSLALLRSGTK